MQAIVLVVIALAAAFVLWSSGQMPEQVGSHFDISGAADSFMSRPVFVGVMLFVVTVVPYGTWRLQIFMARTKRVNIPHKTHWYDEQHHEATVRFLETHAAWFAIALTVFVATVHWLVVRANADDAGRLDNPAFFVVLGTFVAFALGWVAALYARFRR